MALVLQLVVAALITGAQYSFLAMAFSLQYSVLKFFNLSLAPVFMSGAYIFIAVTRFLKMPALIGFCAGIIGAALLGWLLHICIYEPLRKRGSSNMTLLVGAIGAMTALQAFTIIGFGSEYQSLQPATSQWHVFEFGSITITSVQIVTIAVSILIFLSLMLISRKTLFGKATRAIADDEEVAKIMGLNTNKHLNKVVLLSSALAGLGGILVGLDLGMSPGYGLTSIILAITAALIGGMGITSGAFLGAFFLSFAETAGVGFLGGEWKAIIGFSMLILFLIFKPQGILKQ